MNKTFKIVFNKARGALMVANEITGSVQKKGVRTITTPLAIAGGVALLLVSTPIYAKQMTLGDGDVNGKVITSLSDQVTISSPINKDDDSWAGGLYLIKNANNALIFDNLSFSNNKFIVEKGSKAYPYAAYLNGGVFYFYSRKSSCANTVTFSNSSFSNNVVQLNDTLNQKDAWASGGAMAIKGMSITFDNVSFNNNKVEATVEDNAKTGTVGAAATGGALVLDRTVSGSFDQAAKAIFNVTKDLSYTGNSVSSPSKNYAQAYGGYNTTSGGFMFMDRPSEATFNIAKGATLTLGVENAANAVDDSIASSIHGNGVQGDNIITKTGGGNLVIHSTLNDYFGKVEVTEGSMSVSRDWTIKNEVRVTGGTLVLNGKIDFGGFQTSAAEKGIDKAVRDTTGSLVVDGKGELVTLIGNVFADGEKDATFESKSVSLKNGFTFNGGALTLTDEGIYTLGVYNNMLSAANSSGNSLSELTLANASLKNDHSDSKDLTVNTSTTVGSLVGFEKATITAGKALTLNGAGETTSLKEVSLGGDGSQLAALKNTNVEIETLSGEGTVTIGDSAGAGASMRIGKLGMLGTIYVDPEYGHSILQIDSLSGTTSDTLNTNIIAGHGALVTIGADADTAKSAVAKLDNFDAVQSVFYIASPITIGTGGSIDISSELLTSDSSAVSTRSPRGGVTVNSNSALVVDQATIGSSPVFTGTDIAFNGGRLGIVNANVGTITLADGTVSRLTNQAISVDNPFVEATVNGNTVVNTMSAEGGLGALASTGIQAMTRRADTVLAQTIADRTSLDQELAAGTNLWVDVTGERYEADKLDNGGEFKSDMGYGAFGADFAVTQDITAGAAFQYGKGSLRSGVSSIKNSIDSYGVTAYGAMKFGDSKVVAEASYIKNENDITSSQTALNQSVDSEIYSVGVRGQHRFTAGNFQFVPSVGVRVSRLNTDAMQVGAVNIKKQEQTLVQVPIALRVNGFEQNVSGWSVAPSFKIAYVPTFGDKEISVFGADQTVIDTSPVQGDFGIRAQNGNLMLNANMMLGGGKDGTSSVGGKVGLKYVF